MPITILPEVLASAANGVFRVFGSSLQVQHSETAQWHTITVVVVNGALTLTVGPGTP